MMKLIIWGFLFYLIYKFVFELVVPVGKATAQMKDTLKEMQETQKRQYAEQQAFRQTMQQQQQPKKEATPSDDYIDFEDVK